MNDADRAQVAKVAQDGLARLQQDLQTAGATEKESSTILLGLAQLKAYLAGVVVANTSLPGEEKRSLN